MSIDVALEKTKNMLDDFTELGKIYHTLRTAIDNTNAGKASLQMAKSEGAYDATVTGLDKAMNDIEQVERVIQANSGILRRKPNATGTDGIKGYDPPFTFRSRLPTITYSTTPKACTQRGVLIKPQYTISTLPIPIGEAAL